MSKKQNILQILALIILIPSAPYYFYEFSLGYEFINNSFGMLAYLGIIIGFFLLLYVFKEKSKTHPGSRTYTNRFLIFLFFGAFLAAILNVAFIFVFGVFGLFIFPSILFLIGPLYLLLSSAIILISEAPHATPKALKVCCILFTAILIFIPMILAWPNISPTTQTPLTSRFSMSNDGSRIDAQYMGFRYRNNTMEKNYTATTLVFDTATNVILWNRSGNYDLSPDGNYLIGMNTAQKPILALKTNQTVITVHGTIQWPDSSPYVLTYYNNQFNIYNKTNFSRALSSVYLDDRIQLAAINPQGTTIALILTKNNTDTFELLSLSTNTSAILTDETKNQSFNIIALAWSPDGTHLQVIGNTPDPHHWRWTRQLTIWNTTTNTIEFTQNISSNQSIVHTSYGKYAAADDTTLTFYNLSGKTQTYSIKDRLGHTYAISSDMNLISFGDTQKSIIQLQQVSTKHVIASITVPKFEYVRMVPGFEMPLILGAILCLLLLKKRRIK